MPTYDFGQLTGMDFEEIVAALFHSMFQIELGRFRLTGPDGQKLRCATDADRQVLVRSRHPRSVITDEALLVSLRSKDIPALRAIGPKRCTVFISRHLLPPQEQATRDELQTLLAATPDLVSGADIDLMLGELPAIERSQFKLHLASTQIFDRARDSSQRVKGLDVDSLRRNLRTYVQSANYQRAVDILKNGNIIVLSGPPGVGKTALANLLMYVYMGEGYEPVVLDGRQAKAAELLSPGTPQVFCLNDFLGETFLGDRGNWAGEEETTGLLDFIQKIRGVPKAKLILTTRDHILESAADRSEAWGKDGVLDDGRRVCFRGYTDTEKAKILYNHIYFSKLSPTHVEQLVAGDFYRRILSHDNFSPRVAQEICDTDIVSGAPALKFQSIVLQDLDAPGGGWLRAFNTQIKQEARSLLLALASFNGSCSEHRLEQAWLHLNARSTKREGRRPAPHGFKVVLEGLEGTFVSTRSEIVTFRSPSIKDALVSIFDQHAEYVEDLLSASPSLTQILTLWRRCTTEGGAKLLRHFNAHRDLLGQALRRLMASSPDVTLEAQFCMVVSVAALVGPKGFVTLTDKVAEQMIENWDKQPPDFLVAISSLVWTHDAGKKIQRIRRRMLKEMLIRLPNATAADFGRLRDYATKNPLYWSPDDRQALLDAFESYLEQGFDVELGIKDIEKRASFLSKVKSFSDQYPKRHQVHDLVQPAWEEFRDQIVRQELSAARDPSGLFGKIAIQQAQDEQETREMFQSLLD